MADFSSRGSILPVASVSKRLKASRSSSTSSSVSPGRSTFFFAGPLAGTPFFIQILNNLNCWDYPTEIKGWLDILLGKGLSTKLRNTAKDNG